MDGDARFYELGIGKGTRGRRLGYHLNAVLLLKLDGILGGNGHPPLPFTLVLATKSDHCRHGATLLYACSC